jgi:hypothetical protein
MRQYDDARHLGDTVYVRAHPEKNMLELFTSSGVSITNTILLSEEVWKALLRFEADRQNHENE